VILRWTGKKNKRKKHIDCTSGKNGASGFEKPDQGERGRRLLGGHRGTTGTLRKSLPREEGRERRGGKNSPWGRDFSSSGYWERGRVGQRVKTPVRILIWGRGGKRRGPREKRHKGLDIGVSK